MVYCGDNTHFVGYINWSNPADRGKIVVCDGFLWLLGNRVSARILTCLSAHLRQMIDSAHVWSPAC